MKINQFIFSKQARLKQIGISFILLLLIFFMVSCDKTDKNNKAFQRVPMIASELADVGLAAVEGNYELVWSDEFDYNGALDSTKWNYAIGNGSWGWGNNELQYYTNREENALVKNGCLTITAKKESYGGCNYTSSRVNTSNKFDFTYGYVEFKAKLPTGEGTWPALWMMPTGNSYGGWPNSGEIDVMETTGYNPNRILGTIHTGSYNHTLNTQKGSQTTVPQSTTDFNTYGMQWTKDSIKISVNGIVYFTFNRDPRLESSSTGYMAWPFDKDFHLIMNIAMGGTMGGNVTSSFDEAKMIVDYVRVYKEIDETDKEVPSVVEIDSIYSTKSTIYCKWGAASDNQGVKQYEIVVNGKQIAATIKNYYTITNLEPNTDYQIRIISVDWNDNYSITPIIGMKTLQTPYVPGEVKGVSYSNGSNVLVMQGSDTDQSKVLRYTNDSYAIYDFETKTSNNYSISLRLAAVQNIELVISYIVNNVEIDSETLNVTASYGKYKDIALTKKIDLPKGDISIKITCKGSTTGNAMLLNYINVE